jgi:HlyD family secretion protein
MKKKILYIAVGIILVGSSGYFLFFNSNGNDLQYRTEKVQKGDVVLQVRATGTINPIQTVKVGSQVSGTIAKLYADFNSVVRQGQIIAQIDSTFLNASVKEAEANLERNQAQVNEAKRTLDRTKELFSKQLVSQADLDAATTSYEAAIAQLKQSQAALDRVRVNLRYSVIRAPIDGVIISRDVDVGQTVAASLQAPQLFTIANDLKQMQVEASVDEADIGQIKEGQSVTFTVDSYPDEEFRGTVTQVRLAPVTVQNVVTYTVIIGVPNSDLKLRPGMTATVSVLIDKRENVLRVPTLALRFQPPKDILERFQQKPMEEKAQTANDKPDQKPQMRQERDLEKNKEQQSTSAQVSRRRSEQSEPQQGRDRWMRSRENQGQQQTMSAGERKKRMTRMVRVWVLNEKKNLIPLTLKIGLNDNRYVEVLEGEIKEGDEIVLGMSGPEATSMGPQQTNPFQQRMPGGGGRRGF